MERNTLKEMKPKKKIRNAIRLYTRQHSRQSEFILDDDEGKVYMSWRKYNSPRNTQLVELYCSLDKAQDL
jgi:hypothetical protein